MQEFTSISVSSYDAASLADKLTEKSSAGWDVVAIVPAGTNITAYLCRAADAAATAPSWDTGSEDTAADTDADTRRRFGRRRHGCDHDSRRVRGRGRRRGTGTRVGARARRRGTSPGRGAGRLGRRPGAGEPVDGERRESPRPRPEPAPYVQPSGSDDAGQPAAGAEPDYAGEPRLGSTTAGYDTGTTGQESPTPGYETGVSSGAATEPSSYDAGATTEPTSSYESAATEPEASSSYDAGVTAAAAASAEPRSQFRLRRRRGRRRGRQLRTGIVVGRRAGGGGRRVGGAGRLVRRSVGSLRAALLGRQRSGPSTSRGPVSSSPTRRSPDRASVAPTCHMRATSIGHAGILIETAAGSILCDPWFVPAFFGSWFVFPRNDQLDDDLLDRIEHADFLYVTHLHADHHDEPWLRTHLRRDIPILLPGYPTREQQRTFARARVHRVHPHHRRRGARDSRPV